jgi:hypothetical protein
MSAITISGDIALTYDNDNVLFTFPAPIYSSTGISVSNYYYIIYDLTGKIPATKTPNNPITYDMSNGIVENTSYIFRIRAFDLTGNRSPLSSAVAITTLVTPVEPIAPPAPVNTVLESDPIIDQQVIVDVKDFGDPIVINAEDTLLRFSEEPEPLRRPAVDSSKHTDHKINEYLSYGYQGRNKYDFDTMLKIRMGKAQRSLK